MLRFSGAGVSHVGLVRAHNEDAAFIGPYAALVADGVGGAAAGEVASATATYVVSATALARFGSPPEEVLRDAVASARRDLAAGTARDPRCSGMATTLTAVVCDGRRVVLGHLGDSRAYVWRDGALEQVSRDHTFVQQLVDEGRLAPEEVAHHPWRNVVVRSLHEETGGALDDVETTPLDVREGDRILLCSDGLSDLVPTARMREVLRLRDPQSAAAVLVQSALVAGGRDNVTCVVLDVVDGPPVVGDGRLLGAAWNFRNVVDPASVHSA